MSPGLLLSGATTSGTSLRCQLLAADSCMSACTTSQHTDVDHQQHDVQGYLGVLECTMHAHMKLLHR